MARERKHNRIVCVYKTYGCAGNVTDINTERRIGESSSNLRLIAFAQIFFVTYLNP